MNAVIFMGLQASGKSTFYLRRFFPTHLRISLDMLKTRHREKRFLATCIETQLPFVIDNTNPTIAERAVYIEAAKRAKYRVEGYYFQSKVEDCKQRNDTRPLEFRVPLVGILGTANQLELPKYDEGFDQLWYVRMGEGGLFNYEEWRDEV